MASFNIGDINKLLDMILLLVSLGGRWAIYGKELYDLLKSQSGMTDEELRARRDKTLDETERKLLENLAAAGETP